MLAPSSESLGVVHQVLLARSAALLLTGFSARPVCEFALTLCLDATFFRDLTQPSVNGMLANLPVALGNLLHSLSATLLCEWFAGAAGLVGGIVLLTLPAKHAAWLSGRLWP